MGQPMARNLAGAGFEVRAWNRSRDKMEPLADEGVTLCDDQREAVEGADAVVTMLADADVILETLDDTLSHAAEDAVWVQASTAGRVGRRARARAHGGGRDRWTRRARLRPRGGAGRGRAPVRGDREEDPLGR